MKKLTAIVTLAIALLVFGLVNVSRAQELLTNPGFEKPAIEVGSESDTHPDDWEVFSGGTPLGIGLTSVSAHTDKQCVRFVEQDAANFFQGMFQEHAATPGKTYRFSVFSENDVINPLKGSASGQLSIEWQDASNGEIRRDWSSTWGASLSSTNWIKVEMTAVAPANAAKVRFVIVEHGGDQPVAGGVFLVDDASAVQLP
jgi:hypothetical protein